MNQTVADFRHRPFNKISAAEQKRASRFKPAATKEKENRENGLKKDGYKALKMQRALAPVSYGHRTSVKQSIADTDSFKDFDLLPVIRDSLATSALQGLTQIMPTPIQRLAIPAMLDREGTKKRSRRAESALSDMQQFLLAAETGSGKTLAYLLPILDALKRQEMIDADADAIDETKREAEKKKNSHMFALESPPLSNNPHPTTGRPRAIVLLPTAELVSQVGAVVKSLSHTIKFRSALLSSAFTGQVIRNRLFSPLGIDLLISTPHLLSSISESDPNVLSRVSHLVIDEADSLLDRSFAPITGSILDRATPSLKQLILCSATIPRSLDAYIRKRYPDARRLATPNLHAIPRRVQLSVVDVDKDPYKGNRNLACADTIWNLGRDHLDKTDTVQRVIVFVNEREQTVELADYLQTKGVDAVALNRDTGDRKQTDILNEFTGIASNAVPPTTISTPELIPGRRQLTNVKVLVMTDIGSRGIDTISVKTVILYHVPHTSIDFIHRLGRVGRMGRRGKAFVLVGKGDRRDIVKEVREGMFKGQALI